MIDGVVISMAQYSYGDLIAERRLAAKALDMQMLLPAIQKKATSGKTLSNADQKTLRDSVAFAEEQDQHQMRLFARVVKELPQDMLVDTAPEVNTLDLGDPETYQWLRADAVAALKQLVDLHQQGAATEGKS